MHPAEYPRMRAAEDGHWWYAGLRRVVALHWQRHVTMPQPRLLDVGCGTGGNLAALAGTAAVFGIDLAPLALAACRARGLACTALAGAERIPFPDAAFDVALSCDLLCHRSLPDRLMPLKEMHRVLQPGGVLLLNLPAYQWLHGPHDEAFGQDRRFHRMEVTALLRKAGFAPIDVTYWNGLLLPLVALARLGRRLVPTAGSDLAWPTGQVIGRVLDSVLVLEHGILRRTPLPFGTSVFVTSRRA
jgi:SAM-dependent methyltransferase